MIRRLSPLLLAMLSLALLGARGSPQELGEVRDEQVMIPMRDGTRLSAYLCFPKGDGPWPVLYEQRYSDLSGAGSRKYYASLAAAGYVVCAENFRGAYRSEGTWVGYRALGWGTATTRSSGWRPNGGPAARSGPSAAPRRATRRTSLR